MTPLIIWSNHGYDAAHTAALERDAAPHRVVWAASKNNSNLISSGPDPAALDADVLYGQPDVNDAWRSGRVKWVQLTSAGYTRYDRPDVLTHFRDKKIAFCNASSVYDEPCAQHVLAMMMGLARALPTPNFPVIERTRLWETASLMRARAFLLDGQKTLIVGYGAIARRLVELLAPFKLEIIAFRRSPRGDENVLTLPIDRIDDHLPTADFVVNVLPASPSTENFFDSRRLALLPPSALYFNIGRGGTTDQDALADQLDKVRLAGAYLDVTTPEPLPPGDRLWTTKNLHLTPHTAGGSFDEPERMRAHFISNLRRFERGEELVDQVV